MTRLEEIAAKIRASGHPLSSCLSNPFANGFSYTVWFEPLSPQDVVELRRMLSGSAQPAGNLSAAQWRSIDEADEADTRRTRRRR